MRNTRPSRELLCSRELAQRLGAISPMTKEQHRALRDAGYLLVRDPMTSWALFWPWVPDEVTRASS